MKDIPLLFRPWLIRAILEGRKTVTRRLKFTGQPGDRVWVREKLHWEIYASKTFTDLSYGADGAEFSGEIPDDWIPPRNTSYSHWDPGGGFAWYSGVVPSIFMPKWAARIWLNVIDVREEALLDITEEDLDI